MNVTQRRKGGFAGGRHLSIKRGCDNPKSRRVSRAVWLGWRRRLAKDSRRAQKTQAKPKHPLRHDVPRGLVKVDLTLLIKGSLTKFITKQLLLFIELSFLFVREPLPI